MKKYYFIAAFAAVAILGCGLTFAVDTTAKTTTTTTTTTTEETPVSQADILKASEAFGHFLGKNFKTSGINFDLDAVMKGIKDGFNGNPAPLTDKEYETLMTKIQEQTLKKLSTENLKAANEFLVKNAKVAKVVELEPGKLQYIVVQEGSGATVNDHDSPEIKYTGKFLDGSTFGSSDDAGGSITVPLDQTIPGFSKALKGMKEGEKRQIFVHPDLGYGTAGHLPPNSLLIFDVEVLKANNATAKADSEEADVSTDDDSEDDELDIDEEDDEDKPATTKSVK